MRMKTSAIALTLLLASCGREVTQSETKMVGVGYDPDEIGPAPTSYGGHVEYNWVEIAGGGLSLAFLGLLSFDPVPVLTEYHPPYAMIYGMAMLSGNKADGVENTGIVLGAPAAEDACYTSVEPAAPFYITGMDVGHYMEFVNEDGSAGFEIDRVPEQYPPDPQDVFVYYSALASWKAQTQYAWQETESTGDDPSSLEQVVVGRNNFPFGEKMYLRWPGGLPAMEVPSHSIPLPSSYLGDPEITLPNRTEGVRMSWQGIRYDAEGNEAGSGAQSTCLSFYWPSDSAPENAQACTEELSYPGDLGDEGLVGQIYTGPWDTEDGRVTFEWVTPESATDEVVTLSVRFLGELDLEEDDYIRTNMVNYSDPDKPWNGRAALPCEDGDWTLDSSYYTTESREEFIPSLKGDPFHAVVEVTCRLADDGEFTLDNDILDKALSEAEDRNAEGAVFLFARSSQVDAEFPDSKDQYDTRKVISPVLLSARTVEMGRFWY